MVDMRMEMEVDKPAEMVVDIPNEDFTGVTLAIGDSYGDGVRGDDGGDHHLVMDI